MYEQVFGFNDRPFTSTPFAKHYFAAKAIDQTRSQTRMCIERASGPVIVIGNAGTGKTLLLNLIEEHFKEMFKVVNLTCARLDQRSDLLQSILFGLDQPYREMSEGELRLSLIDYLKPSEECSNGILLLVDEAHSLTPGLLEEIRLITNFVRDGQPRVRLVMVGNQRLEDSLADPKLESFNQRIAARCYLENLSYEETQSYIQAHLERVGGQTENLFTDNAYPAVYEVTEGCPRLINQVCEQSFILAATRGTLPINEDCIKEAWWDLQNTPGSWSSKESSTSAAGVEIDEQWTVLEFGSLDGEDSSSETADNTDVFQIATAEEQEQFFQQPEAELDLAEEPEPEGSEQQDFIEESSEETENSVQEETPLLNDLSREFYQLNEMTSTEPNDCSDWPAAYAVDHELQQIEDSVNINEETASNELMVVDAQDPITENDSTDSESSQDGFDESAEFTETAIDEQPEEQSVAAGQNESSASVENPFDEEYEDEEFLIDQYVPLVAEQNRSSLNVTASQLKSLHPPQKSITLAELQADLMGQDAIQQPSSQEVGEEPIQENSDDDQLAANEPYEATGSVFDSPFDHDPDGEPDESSANSELNVGSVEQIETVEDADGYIQRRAEEILESLNLNRNEDLAATNHDMEEQSEAPHLVEEEEDQVNVVSFEAANANHPTASGEVADVAASEHILSEIEKQQEMLLSALSQETTPEHDESDQHEPANSVSIEYPVTQHQLYQQADQDDELPADDRDMIIMTRAEQSPQSDDENDPPDETTFPKPSTGRATRMDYQDLFDQLRQLPSDE